MPKYMYYSENIDSAEHFKITKIIYSSSKAHKIETKTDNEMKNSLICSWTLFEFVKMNIDHIFSKVSKKMADK